MVYASTYRSLGMHSKAGGGLTLPDVPSLVFYYPMDEGRGNAGSMNNMIFDRYSESLTGAEEITNAELLGPYSGGVAPSWSADGSVTATEDTSEPAFGSGQKLTNCNGTSQGLRRSASDGITGSGFFLCTFSYKKNGGSGNIQLQLTNMGGMASDTYDIVPESGGVKTIRFYVCSTNTSTVPIVTADDTSLDFTVYDFSLKEITGGNPMIMDFNVYVDSQRGIGNYDFNGTTQFFYIPDARQTNMSPGSNAFTFAAIINADAGNSTIFSKRRDGGNFEYDFKTIVSRAIRLQFSDDGTTLESIASNGLVTLGATTFVAGSVNLATGKGIMNLNEISQAITYAPDPLTHTEVFEGIARAAIGCVFNSSNNPTNFFNGRCGGACLWNGVALSNEQMVQARTFLNIAYGL